MFHTYQFPNLLLLCKYEINNKTPKLTNNDIVFLTTVISKKGKMKRSTTLYRNDNYEYPLNDENENICYSLKSSALLLFNEIYIKNIPDEEIGNNT